MFASCITVHILYLSVSKSPPYKTFIIVTVGIVMIIIPKKIKEAVLKAIYEKVGLDTPGQGIAFTLPVDDVVGINKNI